MMYPIRIYFGLILGLSFSCISVPLSSFSESTHFNLFGNFTEINSLHHLSTESKIFTFAFKGSSNAKNDSTVFSSFCFQNPDKTWGYDILRSGKIFIHQPTIPALTGLKGFANKKHAEKVANLILEKLKEKPNDFPSITIEELRKLKIINM